MIEPHYCEECKLYHREHHVRAAPYPDEPEQSAQPTCNCGADRTGPSAEAHADTCPVEIYDKAVQAMTDRPKRATRYRWKKLVERNKGGPTNVFLMYGPYVMATFHRDLKGNRKMADRISELLNKYGEGRRKP